MSQENEVEKEIMIKIDAE